METILICCGVNSYSFDAHLTACPDDAQRDFSSISNEYLFEQNFLSYA
jgi:hypothetical protein